MEMLTQVDPLLLAYAGLGAIIILLAWNLILELRLKRMLKGGDGKSIESVLSTLMREQKDIRAFEREVSKYLESIEKRVARSIQSVEAIRFNAFKGTGESGNQSFAAAFLNEAGDGLILSSLYGRGHMSVFSKPVKGRESKYELSKEERHALSLATSTLASEARSSVPSAK